VAGSRLPLPFSAHMTDLVFFYGTLNDRIPAAGARAPRSRLGTRRPRVGSRAALFRSGHLPGGNPAADGRVLGEVHQMLDPDAVLNSLDEIEGYSAREPDSSLYTRVEIAVTLEDGHVANAWVYFYTTPPLAAPSASNQAIISSTCSTVNADPPSAGRDQAGWACDPCFVGG